MSSLDPCGRDSRDSFKEAIMMFVVAICHCPGSSETKIFEFGNDFQREKFREVAICGNMAMVGLVEVTAIENDVHMSIRLRSGNEVSFSFSGPAEKDMSTYQIAVFETSESAHKWLDELFPKVP